MDTTPVRWESEDRDWPVPTAWMDALKRSGLVRRDYNDELFWVGRSPSDIKARVTDEPGFCLSFRLEEQNSDCAGAPVRGQIMPCRGAIEIQLEGYGVKTMEGDSPVIFLELCNGAVWLHAWKDINHEDPSTIKFDHARHAGRKAEA